MTTAKTAIGSAVRGLWWMVLVRGILLVLLGIVTLWQPFAAVLAFAFVFGIYAIADGVLVIIAAVSSRKQYTGWGWLIAQGILTIIAGILIVSLPTAAGLIGVFAILWFLVISTFAAGVMEISAAVRHHGSDKAWGITGGVLDILFGILLALLAIFSPGGTLVATVWVVGIGALVFGIVLIVTAFGVRRRGSAFVDELENAVGFES
jgi:uncharacterized membrane protein HdeD (DUF308 family)